MSELERRYISNNGSTDSRLVYLKLAASYIDRSKVRIKSCGPKRNTFGGFNPNSSPIYFSERYVDSEKDWLKEWYGSLGIKLLSEENSSDLYPARVKLLIAQAFRSWINFTVLSTFLVQKNKQGCRDRTDFLVRIALKALTFTVENHEMFIFESFLEEMQSFFQKCDLAFDFLSTIILTEERKYPDYNGTLREGTFFSFINQSYRRFL